VNEVNEMFQQGVQLMLVGMGVVFALLAVLVLVVRGMSALALAIEGPQPDPPPARGATRPEPVVGGGDLVAAVTAAIHLHRTGAKRQA
jgi:oxaloacetate decarboxylase gamma subunit